MDCFNRRCYVCLKKLCLIGNQFQYKPDCTVQWLETFEMFYLGITKRWGTCIYVKKMLLISLIKMKAAKIR